MLFRSWAAATLDAPRWPAAWDAKPTHYALAPWSRITAGDGDGAEHFAVNGRACRVQRLSGDDVELLVRLPLAGTDGSAQNGDRRRLRRLADLGIIVAPKEDAAERLAFVEPFPDVDLLCLCDERYVVYDRARELVTAINHTGAMVWQMLESGASADELLRRVQGVYGSGFTDEHLHAFVTTLAADGLVHVY